MVPRCTCWNTSGSCAASSFNGVRISSSASAVTTVVYLSAAWK